jgi:CheY-like chemotaxis protein
MRILVVDDQDNLLQHVAGWIRMLRGIAEVEAVGSGAQALERAAAQRPDVVLTDSLMPDMDGFELTRRLKRLPNPPVVVIMTSVESPRFHREAGAAGADFSLEKYALQRELPAFLERRFGVGQKPVQRC